MTTTAEKHILDFVYKRWENEYGKTGVYDFESKEFNEIVNKAFQDLTKEIKNKKTPDKNSKNKSTDENKKTPYLIRIAGQSGSGKTTQLMPAIRSNLDNMNQNYILIAVRLFAKYHPNYNELLKKYGDGLIREKTNGFALAVLVKVAEKLIKNKYNILFEVTLLEPDFEEYMVKISKKNNYIIIYNVLSVAGELSNKWIENRQKNSKNENNRVVFKSSSSYFYYILPKALKKLNEIKNNFDENDSLIIWNAVDELPCFCGNIFDKNFLTVFNKYRQLTNIIENNENKLLESKTNFYKKYLEKLLKQKVLG